MSDKLSELKFAKDASDIIAAIKDALNGKELDPKRFAETPPEWWSAKPKRADVPDAGDENTITDGGHKVAWDGYWVLSEPRTAAENKGWKEVSEGGDVTENDYGEMLAYTPKLTNVALAKQIKPLWAQGKKYRDIAVLCGVSEQYVKYYAACFERAKRASNASPIETQGEGH